MQRQSNSTAIKKDVEELGKIAKEMADDSVEFIRDNVSGYYQKGQEMLQEAEKTVENGVKKYPFRSLLIAAGVGFLFALMRKK
ncbi:MAG: hypothetical protein U1F57_10260 [bacterium]